MTIFLAVLMAIAPQSRDAKAVIETPAIVALTHVNVIDGTGAPARADQTVIIENGRIRDVGDKVAIPDGAKVFDLTGHSVLPGLVSLHDHIMNQVNSAPELYLSFGVTTLRTAGSAEPYADLELKNRIDRGRVAGPELFVTGPFLGHNDRMGMKQVRDAEDGRNDVKYWAGQGVTSIKVYRGITPPLMRAIVDEAHKHNLPVLGHIESTSCAEAAAIGLDSIEHAFGSCRPEVKDEASAAALIKTVVAQSTSMTVTPVDLTPPTAEELEAWHPGQKAEYERRVAAKTLGPGRVSSGDEQRGKPGLEVAFVRAGGRLALGADCTPTNVTRTPGFANIKALKMLYSDRGFSQLEAIRIATLNGASILKIDDRTGSIAKGKEADLLVVKGDPSVHMGDLDHITMVFSNGVAFDPHRLREVVRGMYGEPE